MGGAPASTSLAAGLNSSSQVAPGAAPAPSVAPATTSRVKGLQMVVGGWVGEQVSGRVGWMRGAGRAGPAPLCSHSAEPWRQRLL